MGFETRTWLRNVTKFGDHEAIPMGFETEGVEPWNSASRYHEAIPMGFETFYIKDFPIF